MGRARVLVFFEVHVWPHRGQVLTVNKVAHRERPILTWLQVSACSGVPVEDAAVVVAAGLAAAGACEFPDALLVQHDARGNVLASPAGLGVPVTVLRRAPTG